MLNILRKNAQSIIIQVIVIVIAIVFVFWGVGSNLNKSPNTLAMVNDREISSRDFQQQYEQAVEKYQQQFGGQMPPGFLDSIGLKQQVLNQLIQSELLRQGAEKIGVVASNEATQRRIEAMAVFQNNGRFDLGQYRAVLDRNRLSPTSFEAGIKNDLLLDRVIALVGSFADLPTKELQDWIDYIDLELKLAWTVFKGEDYRAQIKVDDSVLQAWYADKKEQYKSPPQNKLAYLWFSFDADLPQVALAEEAVQQYYQEHSDQYTVPEQRRARHILIKVAPDAGQAEKDAKKSEAEKVLALLNQGGDFTQLAQQYSQDTTRDQGGDLGFFGRGKMVPPFEEAVFSLTQGQVSGLVETPFGYHIIQVSEIRPAKVQALAEVKGAIRKQLEQQAVGAITFKRASTAYEEIIKAGSLAKYSAASGQPAKQTDFFGQNNPPSDPVVRNSAFLQAAFGLRKGELSSMVETDSGYAIIFVEDTKESVVPELSVVRERAEADFRQEKGIELARQAAEALLATVRTQQQWPADQGHQETDYIKRQGPAAAVPEQLVRSAFALVGQAAVPDKVVAVDTSFYVYQIAASRPGKEAMDANKRSKLEQQLLAAQQNRILTEWLGQLRQEAKIWTNAKMLQ